MRSGAGRDGAPRQGVTVVANWRDRHHPDAGGAEAYCHAVARHLAAEGRQVVLLAAAVPGRPRVEPVDGYRVVRGGGRYGVYPFVLGWLWAHRRQVAGVVDSQNGIPFFAPLVLPRATPVLLLLHHVHQDQFAHYLPAPAAAVARWLEGPASRRAYRGRTVVAVSPSTRAGARRVLGLDGPVHVVPPGCAVPPGRPAGERSRSPRVVTVGRLVPHKRVDLVVRAMAAVAEARPDAHLDVVGDGPDRPRLQAIAEGLGLPVTFHGAVGAARRDRLVARAWVAATASAGEGWGISVIEANALGVPVVACRAPGLRDSVRHGRTGWLVDDPTRLGEELVRALQVLAEPAAAGAFAARAMTWAARFPWEATGRAVGDLLDAEAGRPAGADRRRPTDLGTHVRLGRHGLSPGWRAELRATDRVAEDGDALCLVLPGAAPADAEAALRRIGAAPGRVRVARPADLVHPLADLVHPLAGTARPVAGTDMPGGPRPTGTVPGPGGDRPC